MKYKSLHASLLCNDCELVGGCLCIIRMPHGWPHSDAIWIAREAGKMMGKANNLVRVALQIQMWAGSSCVTRCCVLAVKDLKAPGFIVNLHEDLRAVANWLPRVNVLVHFSFALCHEDWANYYAICCAMLPWIDAASFLDLEIASMFLQRHGEWPLRAEINVNLLAIVFHDQPYLVTRQNWPSCL